MRLRTIATVPSVLTQAVASRLFCEQEQRIRRAPGRVCQPRCTGYDGREQFVFWLSDRDFLRFQRQWCFRRLFPICRGNCCAGSFLACPAHDRFTRPAGCRLAQAEEASPRPDLKRAFERAELRDRIGGIFPLLVHFGRNGQNAAGRIRFNSAGKCMEPRVVRAPLRSIFFLAISG